MEDEVRLAICGLLIFINIILIIIIKYILLKHKIEYEKLRDLNFRIESGVEIDRLNAIIDGYIHEIESWK